MTATTRGSGRSSRAWEAGGCRHKEYSFTDCLSFVVMDAFGITKAWAVDADFTHRFAVKPGPAR